MEPLERSLVGEIKSRWLERPSKDKESVKISRNDVLVCHARVCACLGDDTWFASLSEGCEEIVKTRSRKSPLVAALVVYFSQRCGVVSGLP